MRRHEAGSVHVNGWAPVLAALVTAAVLAGPASAATFVVNSTADTLDTNVGNGVCLTSAGTCTLRAAIQEANAQSNPDTIQVPAGIYTLVRNGGGNTAGDFDVIRPLTIVGAGAGLTILDGGQPPSGSPPSRRALDRLIDVSSGAGNVTLAGLTLREGWTSDEGGALRIFSRGLVRLDGVAVVDSSAGTLGGAVYAANTVSTLGARLRLELVDTTIARNRATSGGGVFVGLDADFTLSSSTMADNAATGDGGGLAAVTRSSVAATLSTLQGNTAGGSGGGAFTSTTRPVTIDATLVGGNASLLDGGGLWSAGAGGVTVTKSTLAGNSSGAGGGAASVGGAAVLENTTASGNSAVASGGGIRARAGANLRLFNTTVFGNSSALGGGVAHAGVPVLLRNTIVAGSLAGGTCSEPVSSEGGNIDSGATCALGGPGDRSSTDPLLEPLADNGGPTPTHALRAISPAVDAGVSPCPTTDQRGISRPQNAGCDIGAYELVGVPADTTPPETTIGSGPPAATTATSASFSFGADEAGSTFECALDAAAFAACMSPYEVSGLAVGGHSFAVRATDASGNTDATPAAYAWIVEPPPDTTPPETTIDSGPPATTAETTATFTFSASEAGSSFECALDGAAFAACVSPYEVSGLSLGAHVFAVRATDAAGNADPTPASYGWTVEPPPDTSPPETTIDSGPPATTADTIATFTFSASEAGSSFECALDGAGFAACASPHEVTGLAVGGHSFAVRATDAAGNTDPTPASYSWTVEPPPDTSPPETTIDSGPPATTAETTATFVFSASEAGSSFECSLDGAAFAACMSPYEVSGLSVGAHVFAVRATDASGNTDATPAAYAWIVEPPPDTSPPETTIDSAPPAVTAATSAGFSFSASEAGSTFECSLDGAAFVACASPLSLNGLALGGHTFAVRATDAAGNADPTPAEHAWTVEPPPDTTPPETTVASGPPATTTATSATFVFSASEAGSSFECALDGAALAACVSPHEVTGLSVGGHSVAVRATDAAGNTDPTPAVYSWTVEPPPDTSPPETTIDSGPPATTTATSAGFAFSASEEEATFECSFDGAPFTTCASPLSLTGLALGAHTFAVRATDSDDNTDPTPATHDWTVVEDTCQPTTVTAPIQADAWVDELTPELNGGTDATLAVESSAVGGTARAYVRFALPSQVPNGCVVRSARLRLYTDSPGEGYRFEAQAVGSSWTESGVTWNAQPQAAGAVSVAWTRGGYMNWNVTAQVAAGLDAVRNGFVVRAAGEGTDTAGATGFNAREKAENPPELVIHFAGPDTDDPPDPPAPPEPASVTCGQVLTESTLVTNDLAECPEDGLVIGAPRIVVDLGGHTIDGVGLGTGIANDGHPGVTVRNGTVQQFDHGVLLLAETRGNLLEGLTVQLNEVSGIELFTVGAAAEGNEVRGNTVTGNGGGIAVVSGTVGTLVTGNTLTGNGGGALVVRDSIGNRLEHNLVVGGGDLGVEIERASDNVLLENTVSGTSDGGIEVMAGSHDNLVQGNAVDASGDMGILVSESNRNRVVGNVTHGMSDSGISLSGANDGVVRDNDLRFNPGGLQMDESSRNLVTGNDASETTGYGLEVGGGSFDNDVVENRANGNAAAGIYVSDEALEAPGNRVARNTANGNGGDGILLAKGGHTVAANVTRDNVGWGISAAPGSIDGGGNVASGNGASGGQCSGVACTDGSTPPPPDTSPPETTIDTGPASPTLETAASFTFSASEAGSTFECSLDGAAFAPCASPLALAGLGAGDHELRVRATDAAGNVDPTPAAHAWTILAQSPCEATTVVLGAEADTWILQSSATSNYGDDSVVKVDSKDGSNARVLVRFALPVLGAGLQGGRRAAPAVRRPPPRRGGRSWPRAQPPPGARGPSRGRISRPRPARRSPCARRRAMSSGASPDRSQRCTRKATSASWCRTRPRTATASSKGSTAGRKERTSRRSSSSPSAEVGRLRAAPHLPFAAARRERPRETGLAAGPCLGVSSRFQPGRCKTAGKGRKCA